MGNAERIGWVLGTGLVVAALGMAGSVWPGEAANSNPITVAVAQAAVCPAIDQGRGTGTVLAWKSSGDMSVQELAGLSSRRAVEAGQVVRMANPAGAVEMELSAGSKGGATAMTADGAGMERGLAVSSCDAPGTEMWFMGAESTTTVTTEVVLTNTDTGQASVDLSFYGPAGRIVAVGSRSVQVPGGSSVKVALGPLVRTEDRFAVQVVASSGRVQASARLRSFVQGETQGSGVEWLPQATTPRTEVVVPAIPGGGGKRSLILANPGNRASDVEITELTAAGAKVLPGVEKLTVPPESTIAVPLDSAVKGEAVGLRLVGTQPFTAGVRMFGAETAGDLGATAAVRPFSGQVIAPLLLRGLAAKVQLSNPAEEPATAVVGFLDATGKPLSQQTVTVAPGATAVVDVPQAEVQVARVDVTDGALSGGIVITGDAGGLAGLTILPLRGEATGDVVLDPQRDPGYASRS